METTRIYNDPKDNYDVANKNYVDKVHTEYTDKSIKTTLNDINNGQLVFDNIFTNKIASSNLLNLDEAYVVTNDTTKTIITMNSVVITATADIREMAYGIVNLMDLRGLEGKTISISWDVESNRYDIITASDKVFVELHYMTYEGNRTVINWSAKSGYSFTIPDDLGEYYFLQIVFMLYNSRFAQYLETNVKIDDWIEFKNLQINLGSKKLPYIPYKRYGYNSIESMGSIVVDDIRSKNLFNINNLAFGDDSSVNYETGKISVKGYAHGTTKTLKELAPGLQANKQYTLSLKTTGTQRYIYLQGDAYVWSQGVSHTITQEELDDTVAFYGNYETVPTTTVIISDIQIEEGSNVTDYSEYFEFNNNAVLVDDFIVPRDGFSILDQTIYKQNNRYFGDIVIKKESGDFNTTNEVVCTFNRQIGKSINSACFLAKTQWSAFGVGYMFITINNEIIISDYTASSCPFAKIHIDVVV